MAAFQDLSHSTLWYITLMFGIALIYMVRSRRGVYPPGPRPLPVVGNALDMPRKHVGQELKALTDIYSEPCRHTSVMVDINPVSTIRRYHISQRIWTANYHCRIHENCTGPPRKAVLELL